MSQRSHKRGQLVAYRKKEVAGSISDSSNILSCERSQWLRNGIVWRTGKKNLRKALIGTLVTAT